MFLTKEPSLRCKPTNYVWGAVSVSIYATKYYEIVNKLGSFILKMKLIN